MGMEVCMGGVMEWFLNEYNQNMLYGIINNLIN